MAVSNESELEKGSTGPDTEPDREEQNNDQHDHRLHLPHLHGRRIMHFVHPHSGKALHVCHSPEHAAQKRSELLTKHTLDEFDVVLHGSNEHLEAVRQLHAHHESKRDELKVKHGDIYSEMESVKSELDALAQELHHLTTHAVSLDASFNKYGYSAHLRTKDEESGLHTTHDEHLSASDKHRDRTVEALKFFRRPAIRQYFHKGLLWRSSRAGEVASFELFVDLVYVGVIDHIGETAVEHPDGLSLLHFVIMFSVAWKIWSDLTMIINHFEIDDIFSRVSVMFYLVCLYGFTTNIAYAFEYTYTSAIAFYITQRLFGAVWYLVVGTVLPNIRGAMFSQAMMILISVVFWIGSIHVEWPNQLALIWIALFVDLFGGAFLIWLMRWISQSEYLKSVASYFEFFPAINIEHRVERNNAFVSLVFGYSILTIVFQNHASFGINAFFGKGVLGLMQAFFFNWIYFEVDACNVHVHAIRRHWLSSSIWLTIHLPFIMGYVLAAGTLTQLVLAHDTDDADPHDLGSHYVDRSAAEVENGLRWFYCGGLGVALICMSVISFCHIHKKLARTRLKKRPRLAIRCCIAVIIICLPLAHSLSSLSMISITTALVFLALAVDLIGNSCEGDRFWSGGWCDEEKKKCKYTAHIKIGKRRQTELQKALRRGEKVSLSDLLKRNSSKNSLESELTLRDEDWHGGHY